MAFVVSLTEEGAVGESHAFLSNGLEMTYDPLPPTHTLLVLRSPVAPSELQRVQGKGWVSTTVCASPRGASTWP